MSSDFVTRTELDDLLVQQRRKIERLEQAAIETKLSIESFRSWSIIEASRVRQLETWLLGVLPPEQRACIVGDEVDAPIDGAKVEAAAEELAAFEATENDDAGETHKWRVGDRCFVVRLRRDPPPSAIAVSMWWRLDNAERRVQLYADRVLAGGPEFVSVGITVATVAGVDGLANLITSIEKERELRREDETPTPARDLPTHML